MVDVCIINLDELSVLKRSIQRLLKEKGKGIVDKIIVTDNGSSDGSKEWLRSCEGIILVDLPENLGPSIGRNKALEKTTTKYVFLLDADILYINGAIQGLLKIMETLPDAACVGVHNEERWNGTQDITEADFIWPTDPGEVRSDFPMAWTQWAVFGGDFLRKTKFYDKGVFGKPGNGYEDNFLYLDILKAGLKSYFIPNVLYYHEAHGGQRWLTEKGLDNKNAERKKIFERAWTEYVDIKDTNS